jgi:hypothetical protein
MQTALRHHTNARLRGASQHAHGASRPVYVRPTVSRARRQQLQLTCALDPAAVQTGTYWALGAAGVCGSYTCSTCSGIVYCLLRNSSDHKHYRRTSGQNLNTTAMQPGAGITCIHHSSAMTSEISWRIPLLLFRLSILHSIWLLPPAGDKKCTLPAPAIFQRSHHARTCDCSIMSRHAGPCQQFL